MSRHIFVALSLVLSAGCGGGVYRVPAARLHGSMQTRVLSESTSKLHYDLYVPQERRRVPLVLLGHGWSGTRMDMAELALAATAAGFVVAAPSFPGGLFPDHDHNAAALVRLATHLLANAARDKSLAGRLDGSVIYAGYSAGGLVALLAARHDSRAALYVGLDPVDVSSKGLAAAKKMSLPSVALFADRQACNADGNGVPMMDALRGDKTLLRISGANHCAPAFSDDGGRCASFCGASTTQGTHVLFERLFIEALVSHQTRRPLRLPASGVVNVTASP